MAALTPFNPNIFFQRAAADTAQANKLQSAIGQLASAYANREENAMNKELRKLQMEKMKKELSAPQMPNFEEAAQRVALARASGVEPDPKDMLTVEAGAMIYAPQPVQNPVTGEFYTKETPYSLLTKGQSKPQVFGGAMQGGYEYQPEIPRQGAFSQVPQIDAAMLEEGAPMNVGRGTPLPTAGAPQGGQMATQQQMAAPKGITAPRTGYLKSDVAAATEAAKADIDLQKQIIEGDIELTKSQKEEIRKLKSEYDKTAPMYELALNTVNSALDDIEGMEAATGGVGGFLGRQAEAFPLTEAQRRYQPKIDQLQGQSFLQAFEGLKGGGQITENESKQAKQAISRLQQYQSTEDFRAALEELRGLLVNTRQRQMQKIGGANGVQKGQGQTPQEVTPNLNRFKSKYGLE